MITVKKNFITKLFSGGAASSLRQAHATMLNDWPIVDAENATKAINRGYCSSDIVYSIVSKKATTGARAPFGVYRIKSISKAREYKAYLEQKDIKLSDLRRLKSEAIEAKPHILTDLYANPNMDMSASEYTEAALTYLNITGDSFEQAIRKGKRGDVLQFYIMPADFVEIITDGNYPITAVGYRLQTIKDFKFERGEVIHTKYFNPKWDATGSHLYGLSPISVGWNLINGDNEGWDALWEQRKNRGARKMAAIESDAVKSYAEGEQAMMRLKEEFNSRSREFRDRVMPIYGKLSVHDVGLSEKDMQILLTAQLTFDRLCNLWHVPTEWFNTDKQSKYNNLEQYNKQAIINGIIPDLNKLRDSRNMWARQNNIITDSEMIDYDPTVFTELDVDRERQIKWLKDAPLTPNEQRSFLGEQSLPLEGMDNVYLPRNKVGIDKINDLTNEQASAGQETNAGASGEDQESERGGEK